MKTAERTALLDEIAEEGFATRSFPDLLRMEALQQIEKQIRDAAAPSRESSLEALAKSVPDSVWSAKMTRAMRIFPKALAHKMHQWADNSFRRELGRKRSAVNVVYPQETATNPTLTQDDLAIYWRCVRPGKPDAGRPHRDASFWDLEFKEGYDPRVPFQWNYLTDCIKIWIPLKGCIPTTTLQIIPRSHRMEIDTIVEQTEYGRRPNIHPNWLSAHEKDFMSPASLSQGHCILFDMNLVHRGPQHNNPELRISAELNFILEP